jgi:hypothetical protein
MPIALANVRFWEIADIGQRRLAIGYGALQATMASGRVRLATEGGAKIAR